jgi:hypothetical protein
MRKGYEGTSFRHFYGFNYFAILEKLGFSGNEKI